MTKAFGIITSSAEQKVEGLQNYRSIGAFSFLGRYRVIDFPISNFSNSDIDRIQVYISSNPRSIVSTIGTGRHYNINSKKGRIQLLFPTENNLNEIYNTPAANGSETFEPDGHDIEFKNVSFSYNDEEVLHEVSFIAKEGEVTALVGPSGSGKSTCASLAARLWDVSSGSITVGGIDIKSVDPEVLLTDYSMVFQDVVLFDDTVRENIRLGKHGASDEEVYEAAKAANCLEFIQKMPEGFDTMIGENGARLSGGERQRISIARALLKNAPIVLLDEATASLDVENETKVQSALSRLLKGKTVLVIAHRMRTVENADKIIVLSEGKVAEQGSPKQLYTKENGIYRHMYDLQLDSSKWSV